jgi:NAD(P)-dependent dehydrogenase (short-subunit alcohol dehydrogenase family)
MFRLEGKCVVVTGSCGLLGKEMCMYLQQAGATVVGIDIVSQPESDLYIKADLTQEEELRRSIAKVLVSQGKIDGWINNAYPRTSDWAKKVEDIDMASWRSNVDMQMNSYFMCSRLVLQEMAKFGRGSVVNMSSIYGVVGPDFSIYSGTSMTMPAAYAAIKGGVINMTRYLASYFGPSGLRVNCISPGGIEDRQPDPFIENYCNKVPLRRMGTPKDIAPSVVFLMSDEAAYITGHNLMVDGGWTAI